MSYYVIGEALDGVSVTDIPSEQEARNIAHKLSIEWATKGSPRFVVYGTEKGKPTVRAVTAFRAGVELERW